MSAEKRPESIVEKPREVIVEKPRPSARLPRGYSVEVGRGDAAATTSVFRGAPADTRALVSFQFHEGCEMCVREGESAPGVGST